MKTTKVYIHKKDLAYLAKHPGDNGAAFYLSKTECAENYAGRCDMSFKFDDSVENYPHIMDKIVEFDLNYINDADFTPENAFYLSLHPIYVPTITVVAAFDLEDREIKGLYTRSAFANVAADVLANKLLSVLITCVVRREA